MRLQGKVALITGGASGMGRVASGVFAGEGADVVLSDVSDDAGEATVAEISRRGGDAAYVHADVSKAADAEGMVRFAVERFGRLDILYNNAGVMLADDGSVTDTAEDVWDRTMFRYGFAGPVLGIAGLCYLLGFWWGLLAAALHLRR